jgi:hypothetical protein
MSVIKGYRLHAKVGVHVTVQGTSPEPVLSQVLPCPPLYVVTVAPTALPSTVPSGFK